MLANEEGMEDSETEISLVRVTLTTNDTETEEGQIQTFPVWARIVGSNGKRGRHMGGEDRGREFLCARV